MGRLRGPRPWACPTVRLLVLFALLLLSLHAGIIDRVAVTVGNDVITISEVELQLRIAALIDGKPITIDEQSLREAADRRIQQVLIRREMVLGDYPATLPEAADNVLTTLKQDRFGGSEERYRAALTQYKVSEDDLREQLQWQLTLLRFIDLRFRPGVQVPSEDIRSHYRERFIPQWRESNSSPPPPLGQVRDQLEETLAAEQLNSLLDRWLNVTRTQLEIEYRDAAFREAAGGQP